MSPSCGCSQTLPKTATLQRNVLPLLEKGAIAQPPWTSILQIIESHNSRLAAIWLKLCIWLNRFPGSNSKHKCDVQGQLGFYTLSSTAKLQKQEWARGLGLRHGILFAGNTCSIGLQCCSLLNTMAQLSYMSKKTFHFAGWLAGLMTAHLLST